MDFSSMSDEELLKPDAADGNVRPSNISALSDEELLKPDAPNVSGMSDEELLKPDDQPQPPEQPEQKTDGHWKEMEQRKQQFNLGDEIVSIAEPIKEGIKGGWDVVSSVANPVVKLVGDVAQGLGNISAHGLVMPNGIVIGGRGELGGNRMTPDELAMSRRQNIGTAVGGAINKGADTIFPIEPNDNPVTAKIQKIGNEVGGLLRFTIGSPAALGASEYGPQWNADYDEYIKAGKTPSEAAMWADLGGITNAAFAMALKKVPVSHYFKKMFGLTIPENLMAEAYKLAGTAGEKELKSAVTKILASQLIKDVMTEAAVLGGVSGAQTAATGAIQQLGVNGEIDPMELAKSAGQSALHGATTGAVMAALPGAVNIPEARNKASVVAKDIQKAQAMSNRAKLSPEQEIALDEVVPQFNGENKELNDKVKERIREKMAFEAVNGTPEGEIPLRERLSDPKELENEVMKATEEVRFSDNTAEIAKSVNTKSLGMKAGERATELAREMPITADQTESRIAGEIAAADPNMKPGRIWEIAEYLATHDRGPEGGETEPLTKDRIALIENEMAADKAGTYPVAQPDGSFKTVGEIEAETARAKRETPFSRGWTAYQKAKDEFAARQKKIYESGVTPEELQQSPELIALNEAQHKAYEKFESDPNESTAAEVEAAMKAMIDAAEKYAESKPITNRAQIIDSQNGTDLSGIVTLAESLEKRTVRGRGEQHTYKLAKGNDLLKSCGLSGDYFTIKTSVITSHYGKDADHVITPGDWANIATALQDPLVVTKYTGKANSYRVWVEAKINDHYAVVGVEIKSPGKNMTVNAIKTVFGDAHIDIDKSNVVYSRKNGEGLRTLLGEPNSPEYPETPHAGNSIAQNGDGVNRDGKPVDHSGDWTPVEGKDGVWHTAEYPEVEIDLQDVPAAESGKAPVRTMFIDNLPDLATLDEAGQMKLGKFLVEQRAKAEKAGVEEINLGKTPEEAAKYQELADRYEQKVNGEKFQVRSEGVVEVLKKSGLAADVVSTEAEFNAKLEQEGYALQAKDGRTYGFTDGTNVYLNPAFFGSRKGLSTPIHEFGHLGIIATKKINAPLYNRGIELIKQTGIFKEVSEHPEYARGTEESRAQEALTRLIEQRGENLEANTPKGVVAEIKKWLVEFWQSFGKQLGIRDLTPDRIEKMTVEDVADAIRAEMMSGREFGTRELSLQEGDLKAKILRFAKYKKPTSNNAKAALEAAKKAWKGLSEEQKTALAQYGDTEVLKTPEARTIATGIRTLREWDARRARISQQVKERIKKAPNEGQKRIITGSPKYYVSEVSGNVTTPFAYVIEKGIPIPRKGDWGWDAWANLTDGMKYKERRALEKLLGGEHPQKGGWDTVLSDYAQWAGMTWDEGARDFEYGRGIEDFLNDVLKEREAFEKWKSGDRKTRDEIEAERIRGTEGAGQDRKGGEKEGVGEYDMSPSEEELRIELEREGMVDESDDIPFSRAPIMMSRKEKIEPDLSKQENAKAFKKFVKEIPAAPLPERLHDSNPKTVFEWYLQNMVGKTYSFDIPGYGYREFKPKPGHIGKLVCSGGKNQDGSKIVKGRIRNGKAKNWQERVIAGEIEESDVEGWDPARARSITLIPEVLESFDFVLHEKDEYQRDILIFAKKFTNKKGKPNTIVMRLIDDGTTIGPVSTHMKDFTKTWLKNKDLVVTNDNEIYGRGKDNSANQTPLPAANAENYSTGIKVSLTNPNSDVNGGIMLSRGGLYTGSAADYEKPSLLKVGTGEGSQVYGWGLYASSERGVAEHYADRDAWTGKALKTKSGLVKANDDTPKNLAADYIVQYGDRAESYLQKDANNELQSGDREAAKRYKEALKAAKNLRKKGFEIVDLKPHLYEQTFFTNRAPGDESHLLNWYEPVGKTNANRVLKAIDSLGIDKRDLDATFGKGWRERIESLNGEKAYQTVEAVYKNLVGDFDGNESQAASELLAKFDIDGIKYPVDSYGKTVKDGDKAGWNYVSFRDDNINVDHKWVDGEMLFDRGKKAVFVGGRTRVADDAEHGELTPGGLASARELAAVRSAPVSTLGTRRFLSLPISDLEELRKMVSGDTRPAHVARTEAGAARTEGSIAKGKVAIWSDLIGVVDRTDMEAEKANLKQHGFYLNEDPGWCMGRSKAAIRAERERSEKQLSRQLELLGERRLQGQTPGGQTAERGVFADEVAKVVLSQQRHVGGRLGRLQTIGKSVQDAVTSMTGMNSDVAQASARQFLDWAYGQKGYSRNMGGKELTAEMFGKWLVMPRAVQQTCPEWANAIEGVIAGDRNLSDAFRTLATRRLSGDEYLFKKLRKQNSRQTESVLMKLHNEANEPISTGSKARDLWEGALVALHDTFGPVYIRMNAETKLKIKAMKKALKAAPPEARPALKQQLDLYLGDLGEKLNRLELARTAYERGALNEGSVYYREMLRLENEATERWGLSTEDLSNYLDQMRVIETGGRSGSFGEDAVQANAALKGMERRLGAEKWRRMQEYGNRFFAIHERELLDDPRAERMFGKAYIDYLKSMTHYVTTERVHSQEELDAIGAARAAAKRAGVSGGDDVVGQMYAYGGAKGAGSMIGEGGWTVRMSGSFAAKMDARGATFRKVDRLQRALRRNQLILDLREALQFANVKGVRDLARSDGSEFPEGNRYGHLNYIENGHKRTLVVPRQIADAFKRDTQSAGKYANAAKMIQNAWRSVIIDYNPSYWPMNIRRNQASIEKNMPGMRETYVKTALRGTFPGLGSTSDLVFQTVVRNIPATAKLFSDKTIFHYIPQMERICKIIENPSKWQRDYWKAEDEGNYGRLEEMNADWRLAREMLKANVFVSLGSAYRGEITETFAADSLAKKGLKTIDEINRTMAGRSKTRRFFDSVNFLKKNQAMQEHEDILAKGIAYLADRRHFGLVRSAAESGALVNSRVSIAQGERRGRAATTMKLMVPFYNMIEKGVVRHWDAYRTDFGHTLGADAKFVIGNVCALLMAKGVAQKWMLKNSDNDEKKAREKFGKFYGYAKDYHAAYRNCSEYVRKNYEFIPLWTEGWTSVILGGAMTDEEKLLSPIVQFTVGSMAAAEGLEQQPSFGSTILDMSLRSVVPDMQMAGPIIEGLRLGYSSVSGENYTDFFRNAPAFNQKDLDLRFESWQDFGDYSAAVGGRAWNYFGGRSVLSADVNGVDNGRGEAPESLETALRKIPWISPMINRMVKIQVGSPNKDGTVVREERKHLNAILDKCAARLLDKCEGDTAYHYLHPKEYEADIARFARTYDLNDHDQAELRAKYLNAFNQRRCRESLDRRALNRMIQEGRRQGMTESEIWVLFGDR